MLQGVVKGTPPPLDLGALVHMPATPVPPPQPTASSESPPEDRSYFEIGQASPAAVMVPPAGPPVPIGNATLVPVNSGKQASPDIGVGQDSGLGNGSRPVGSEQPSGPPPNSPTAANGGVSFGLPPSPPASSSASPAAPSPAFLQGASPRQGLSAAALLAQRSPTVGAPVAPSLIPLPSEATVAPAESDLASARAAKNASSPGAATPNSPAPSETALECHLHAHPTACPSLPVSPSSPHAQTPVTGSPPTTTTPSTPQLNPPSPPALTPQPLLFASSSASLPSNPPPATSPSPPLTSPYTYISTSYGAAALSGPDAVPTSLLPYGIPLPMYAALPPAPASAPTPAPAPGPALAPGTALAPAAASAPSSVMLSRLLLASSPGQTPLPAAHSSSAPQLKAVPPMNPNSRGTALPPTLAQGPNTAQLTDNVGAVSARVEASVSPAAGESSGKGNGGLDAKTIGIVAGAVAAGAVVLSKHRASAHSSCQTCMFLEHACNAAWFIGLLTWPV